MPITWRNVAAPQNYAGSQQFGQGVRTVMDAANNLVQFGQQEQRNNIGQLNTAQTEAAERSLLDIAGLSGEELQQRQEAMRANPEQFQEQYGENFGRVNEAAQNRQNALDEEQSVLDAENQQRALLNLNATIADKDNREIESLVNDPDALIERFGAENAPKVQAALQQQIQLNKDVAETEAMERAIKFDRRFKNEHIQQTRDGEKNARQIAEEQVRRAQSNSDFAQRLISQYGGESESLEIAAMNYADQVTAIATQLPAEDSQLIQTINAQNEQRTEQFKTVREALLKQAKMENPLMFYNESVFNAASADGQIFNANESRLIDKYKDTFGDRNQSTRIITGVHNATLNAVRERARNEGTPALGALAQGIPDHLMDRIVSQLTTSRESWWNRRQVLDEEEAQVAISNEVDRFIQDYDNYQRRQQIAYDLNVRAENEFLAQQESSVNDLISTAINERVSVRELLDSENYSTGLDAESFFKQREQNIIDQERTEELVTGQAGLSGVDAELSEGNLLDGLEPEEIQAVRQTAAFAELEIAREQRNNSDNDLSKTITNLEQTLTQLGEDTTPEITGMFADLKNELKQSLNRQENTVAGQAATNIESIGGFRDAFTSTRQAVGGNQDLNSWRNTPLNDEVNLLNLISAGGGTVAGMAAGTGNAALNDVTNAATNIRDLFTSPLRNTNETNIEDLTTSEQEAWSSYVFEQIQKNQRPMRIDDWIKERRSK